MILCSQGFSWFCVLRVSSGGSFCLSCGDMCVDTKVGSSVWVGEMSSSSVWVDVAVGFVCIVGVSFVRYCQVNNLVTSSDS